MSMTLEHIEMVIIMGITYLTPSGEEREVRQ